MMGGRMDDVVATTGGKVRGTRLTEGVRAFRGIPFAAPPFGPLRLRAPEPARPWDGVREADGFGPVPPQAVRELSVSGAPAPDLNFGEDILTVNVFAPEGGGAVRHARGQRPVHPGDRAQRAVRVHEPGRGYRDRRPDRAARGRAGHAGRAGRRAPGAADRRGWPAAHRIPGRSGRRDPQLP